MWPETDWPSSAIKRTNRLNMDFVYPQEIPQNKSSNLSHGPIFAMDTLSTGSMDRFIHKVFIIYIIVITESREFVIDTYALKLV